MRLKLPWGSTKRSLPCQLAASRVFQAAIHARSRNYATPVGDTLFEAGDASVVAPKFESEDWVITSSGVRMPRLIYGTAWKEERTKELVLQAARCGFRGIDTACQPKHYREDLVGEALQELFQDGFFRKDLFLQTKFTPLQGHDPERVPYDTTAPLGHQVAQSFATSLQNLKIDFVDSLVLHSPCETMDETMEVWGVMEHIVKNLGARQLGISNCYDLDILQKLHQTARVKPAVVQNRFYAKSGYDSELRIWCASEGIRYQSFWTLTANPKVLSSPEVQMLAKARDRSAEQVFLRFAMDEGICPLTGTSSAEHMAQDLQVLKDPPLGDEAGKDIFSFMMSQSKGEQSFMARLRAKLWG